MSELKIELPTYDDVKAAASRLAGHAVRTPLINSPVLDDQLGAKIFFKAECLQRTGSFKFRGAYNTLVQLDKSAAQTGVLACSSGNHAQGVAEAAQMLGYPATIIMPSDAPESKKMRTVRSGAKIVEYDRFTQDREALAANMALQWNMPMVHPYEHPHVIAGQGTCAIEFCEDMKAQNLVPDHILVCAGGGGLMAGITLVVQEEFPSAKIHPVEPQGFDDQARSHELGERLPNEPGKSSICDAILTPMPGAASFDICKDKVAQGLQVSDDEALRAVAFAFRELKLVVEPGGGVTLAALLAGKLDVTGKTIVCTLSGGNIDPDMMSRALAL